MSKNSSVRPAARQPEPSRNSWNHWIEVASTVLLALATVGSAWCAYQATLWDGIQIFRLADSAVAGRKAAEKSVYATQQRLLDIGMFVNYANAISQGNESLAQFLRERFRPELAVAVEAWLATDPLENKDAPTSPFAMKEYSLGVEREAEQLALESTQLMESAHEANENSDDYIYLTVLFATVLFFGGIGTKFEQRILRILILALGAIVFLVSAIALAHFPITMR